MSDPMPDVMDYTWRQSLVLKGLVDIICRVEFCAYPDQAFIPHGEIPVTASRALRKSIIHFIVKGIGLI